jgi:hypothetical protein
MSAWICFVLGTSDEILMLNTYFTKDTKTTARARESMVDSRDNNRRDAVPSDGGVICLIAHGDRPTERLTTVWSGGRRE